MVVITVNGETDLISAWAFAVSLY